MRDPFGEEQERWPLTKMTLKERVQESVGTVALVFLTVFGTMGMFVFLGWKLAAFLTAMVICFLVLRRII